MAKTSRPRAGRRTPPRLLPQRRQLPWGTIVAAAVVAMFAGVVIAYAVVRNRASTDAIPGVKGYTGLSRSHVIGAVSYPLTPPVGGDHAATPQTCGVYTAPVPNENAVHSLEHGAVWLTYQPGLAADQVARLVALVKGNDHRMLSPYPGQPAPVMATAWGEQLSVSDAGDTRLQRFVARYTQGPQGPEPGAGCARVGTPTG